MKKTCLLGMVLFLATAASAADLLREYVTAFNTADEELYTNTISNVEAYDFLKKNIPLFECPDKDIERTYYFRWWTYRKHMKKTSDGWVVTEFLPNVKWAGKHNTISCPLGHHIREGRWLKDTKILDDYTRFMVTQGTLNGLRAYANWPAWATLERAKVTGDDALAHDLLSGFVKNWEAWNKGWMYSGNRRAGYRADYGLFDIRESNEGTEFALSVDGARPMVNAALWAEASAIAEIAKRVGDTKIQAQFTAHATALERNIKAHLWNKKQKFFTSIGYDGKLDDVCELHGYAPFYFRMPLSADYLVAWDGLMDENGFSAPIGLTFPRRDTPGFNVTIDYNKHECLWDGPSWPYATSVALTALYETLQSGAKPEKATATDFVKLMKQFARQHVRVKEDGTCVPWIDENLHPFTGVWVARDILIEQAKRRGHPLRYRERGKDYNHSSFCDLVIAGICGFVPQDDGTLVINSLAPADWDWFRLECVRYHGRNITITWDKTGKKYGKGAGFYVICDGVEIARNKEPRATKITW